MSIQRAAEHLKKYGMEGRILEFAESSATVEMAAEAVGCTDCQNSILCGR